MIFGNIFKPMLEEQLAVLPAPLRSAIRFLKDNDMAAHEPGVFNIELDGLPVILQVLDLDTKDRENLRPEIHRKNIDVQFLAKGGPEEAGFYSKDETGQVDEDLLDTPRDILFFRNDPSSGGTHTPGSRLLCHLFPLGCPYPRHPGWKQPSCDPQDCYKSTS